MKKVKEAKPAYAASLDRDSGCGRNAMIFLAIAIAFRALGLIQRDIASRYQLVSELILPIAFCAAMLLCVVLFGKHLFRISLLPAVLGTLFFILRSLSADNILCRIAPAWEIAVRILVYLLILVLYSIAVLRNCRVKWILVVTFAVCALYHLICEGYPAIIGSELKLTNVMMELSVLFMLAAFFFIALAFRPVSYSGVYSEPAKAPGHKERKGFFSFLNFGKKNRNKEKDNTSPAERSEKLEKPVDCTSSPESVMPEDTKPEPEPEAGQETVPDSVKPSDSASDDKEEKHEADDVTNDSDDDADTESSGKTEKVIDDSFFEEPYKATLTLDP